MLKLNSYTTSMAGAGLYLGAEAVDAARGVEAKGLGSAIQLFIAGGL